ncbi:M-phase inducer phosphatase-like [Uloborus diversus]|uniref:M-phase inducer phosphatase-like n=1 Tax=Uloborus diversus TaxID=327109 RepID=UPI00240A362D|nr:M-phase inducer phosphatase-like [Uloborus diversus]
MYKMTSPTKHKNNVVEADASPQQHELTALSPVTNLAFNLKSLSTSKCGTPIRRISWSNPYSNEDSNMHFMKSMSPYVDSPTFFENVPNKCKSNSKLYANYKTLPSDSDEDKENAAPSQVNSKDIKSGSTSSMEFDSQDSGYSGFGHEFSKSSFHPTPRAKVRSSIFADDVDEDSLENFFDLEDFEAELTPMPDMTNLLTKPLHDSFKAKYPSTAKKEGKQPIRRCLSMDVDCELSSSNSPSQEIISQKGTYIATNSLKDNARESEITNKYTFKRPEPPDTALSFHNKRRKSSPSIDISPSYIFKRSYSETATTIMYALQQTELQPELIGDCSKAYALPLIRGRHQDLKCISSETLVKVLKGEFHDEITSCTIVDCRYPYEFDGGHIQGAKNIYTKEDILEFFLKDGTFFTSGRDIIVFHCEFSSERAPNLCRFLRNKDREKNEGSYPRLHHPEIYILEGGYKAFYEHFKEYCEPQSYTPMNHKDHGFDLRHFRAKSKSWGADSKLRYTLKSSVPKQQNDLGVLSERFSHGDISSSQ